MRFTELALRGAWQVDITPHEDDRGFFARTWCADSFREHGLDAAFQQCSVSYNHRRGTLRGMHFQAEPHGETKLIRCTAGAMYDVIIDLRADSPTFRHWAGVELSAENHRMLYVPAGFAHGFQTLADGTEVFYQISEAFRPEAARGVRWNDAAFGIEWPEAPTVISSRDASFPDFTS